MKLKQLESILQDVEQFEEPKIELEQYPTSPHLASRILFAAAYSYDDIEDKFILDLGCGTGIFAIGATVLGCSFALGVDIDTNALAIASKNFEDYDMEIDLLQADISAVRLPLTEGGFDTVIMNPPFGTRKAGADIAFLQSALKLSKNAVYSLHKSSTRDYIIKRAEGWKVKCEILAQLRFDLPRSYEFHKKDIIDIEVDLVRFTHLAPQHPK